MCLVSMSTVWIFFFLPSFKCQLTQFTPNSTSGWFFSGAVTLLNNCIAIEVSQSIFHFCLSSFPFNVHFALSQLSDLSWLLWASLNADELCQERALHFFFYEWASYACEYKEKSVFENSVWLTQTGLVTIFDSIIQHMCVRFMPAVYKVEVEVKMKT